MSQKVRRIPLVSVSVIIAVAAGVQIGLVAATYAGWLGKVVAGC